MLPSLAELLAWPTEHLTEAADYWETIGERCFGLAHGVWSDAISVDWQGEAAEALRTGTHADMLTTSGPLGMANCQDTGESLTMKIVVDTRKLADGLQKGVITMYPLQGGSGVVELKPKWTWTPPWVNNNVPIN